MGEPHVISALVSKRAEIAGELRLAEDRASSIRANLQHIDRVLAIFGFGAKPETIPPTYKRPPRMFKAGHLKRMVAEIARGRPELATDAAIGAEVVSRMGWDTGNAALVKAVSGSVHKVRWRMKRG